jgi:hypothetical protein
VASRGCTEFLDYLDVKARVFPPDHTRYREVEYLDSHMQNGCNGYSNCSVTWFAEGLGKLQAEDSGAA